MLLTRIIQQRASLCSSWKPGALDQSAGHTRQPQYSPQVAQPADISYVTPATRSSCLKGDYSSQLPSNQQEESYADLRGRSKESWCRAIFSARTPLRFR